MSLAPDVSKNKLIYLEGLRGVAVMLVLFCHLRNTFAISFTDELLEQLKQGTHSYLLAHTLHSFVNILFDGNLAVNIFWFMSAYVISVKLFIRNDRKYLFQSISKRYLRLMIPALSSILLAFFLLQSGLLYNSRLAEQLGPDYQHGWLGSFYQFSPDFFKALKCGIWDTFFQYNEATSYNSSLWTMQPELYGSLFCFLLFGILGLNKHRFVLYVLAIGASLALKYYALTSFLLGFALCDIDHTKPPRISRVVDVLTGNRYLNTFALLCLLILGGKPNFFDIADLFIGAAIVVVVMRTTYLRSFLQGRLFVWLGKLSFSIYLLHLPVICSLSCYLYLTLPMDHSLKVAVICVITIAVTLALSALFTRYIDKNGVKLSDRFARWVTRTV